MADLSDADKEVFNRATERRREAGIRLKRFAFMGEESQVQAIGELYDAWVERFGKIKALDHLIVMWSGAEARLRDKERARTKD